MQPLTKHREVTSGGVTDSTTFGLSLKDSPHLKRILRQGIYSDKVLAVLREYSANAWDAHRMAGKHDRPIKVSLPTWSDPNLIIEDYGPGLSHEDVFGVFAQYGASTKRETNEAVGMLGIGSKSGFAYSDTFTIVSRHGGKKRTYVALLDESEDDALSLLAEEDWWGENGITIQIAVRNEDIREFHQKARELFQHFQPRPDVNLDLPPVPAIRSKLQHGIIYDNHVQSYESSSWFAVMGCVPYKIELDQLKGPNGETLVSEGFRKTSGLLIFDIGGVQINASREALEYTKITKQALVQKFEDLLTEFVTVTLDEIEQGGGADWDKRIQAQTLTQLGLGKKEIGTWAHDYIKFEPPPVFFKLNGTIPVSHDVVLVRHTNTGRKTLRGFKLNHKQILVSPLDIKDPTTNEVIGKHPWDVVEAELQKLIQDHKLGGIQIVDLHTLPWQPKYRRPRTTGRVVNAKHLGRVFELGEITHRGEKHLSLNWEVADRTPELTDVFVILSHFKAVGFDLYEQRLQDEKLAEFFGPQLPAIYGYKTTEKKPVTVDTLMGTHYPEWRKKFLAELPQDKIKEVMEKHSWIQALMERTHYQYDPLSEARLQRIIQDLGDEHVLCVFMRKVLDNRKDENNQAHGIVRLFGDCGIKIENFVPEAQRTLRDLGKRYPLLASRFDLLWNEQASEWRRYVKLIDNDSTTPPEPQPEPFTLEG